MAKKIFAKKAKFNRSKERLEITCGHCKHEQKVNAIDCGGSYRFGSAANFCDECNMAIYYKEWPPEEV